MERARTPSLSNKSQLAVMGLVKAGMPLDDALKKAEEIEAEETANAPQPSTIPENEAESLSKKDAKKLAKLKEKEAAKREAERKKEEKKRLKEAEEEEKRIKKEEKARQKEEKKKQKDEKGSKKTGNQTSTFYTDVAEPKDVAVSVDTQGIVLSS